MRNAAAGFPGCVTAIIASAGLLPVLYRIFTPKEHLPRGAHVAHPGKPAKGIEQRRNSEQIQIQKKGECGMKNKGYTGRIQNSGTQVVKAPNGSRPATKGNTRITGNDLRGGSKGCK